MERSTTVLKMKVLLFPAWRFPCWERLLTTESQCKPTEPSKTGPWPPPNPGQHSHITANNPAMLYTGIYEASQRTSLRKRFGFKPNFFCFYLGVILPHTSSSVQFTFWLQNHLCRLNARCKGRWQVAQTRQRWHLSHRNAAQANETVPLLSSKCPSATSYL